MTARYDCDATARSISNPRRAGRRAVTARYDRDATAAMRAPQHSPRRPPPPPASLEDVSSASDADENIEARTFHVDSLAELQQELQLAGDRLVVLEVMKESVCETGLQEPDDGWTPDRHKREEEKLKARDGIHHQFTRMACDSPDVRFLETFVRPPPSFETLRRPLA